MAKQRGQMRDVNPGILDLPPEITTPEKTSYGQTTGVAVGRY